MPELAFLGLFVAALLAFTNWRAGMALCVATAILQDPLRKLTPGEPVYFVVLVGVVFGAAFLGALVARVPLMPNSINGWRRNLGAPFAIFMILVVLQSAHSLARFGNPIMTAMGLLFYVSPLPALVFGYQFAVRRGISGISRWMWFYVVITSASLAGVYLEYAGVDWRTLGAVGVGLTIFDVNTVLKAYSGFFRSSEIAAWHAATIACFVLMLLFRQRISLARFVPAVILVLFLLGVGMLTGRRKMLVEVAIFVCVYFMLIAWFQRGAWKLAALAGFAAIASFVGVISMVDPDTGERSFDSHDITVDPEDTYRAYALRGRSVISDIPDRISGLGFQPILWAVRSYGVFGAGLGTGSQGMHHFSGGDAPGRGAAEGGLGKLTMELGLPGLFVVGWLAFALARFVWRSLASLSRTSPQHARFGYGFVAFLAANVAAFSVATQAYADLFILLSLGWACGMLLSLPVLAQQRETRVQPAQVAQPRPTPLVESALRG